MHCLTMLTFSVKKIVVLFLTWFERISVTLKWPYGSSQWTGKRKIHWQPWMIIAQNPDNHVRPCLIRTITIIDMNWVDVILLIVSLCKYKGLNRCFTLQLRFVYFTLATMGWTSVSQGFLLLLVLRVCRCEQSENILDPNTSPSLANSAYVLEHGRIVSSPVSVAFGCYWSSSNFDQDQSSDARWSKTMAGDAKRWH